MPIVTAGEEIKLSIDNLSVIRKRTKIVDAGTESRLIILLDNFTIYSYKKILISWIDVDELPNHFRPDDDYIFDLGEIKNINYDDNALRFLGVSTNWVMHLNNPVAGNFTALDITKVDFAFLFDFDEIHAKFQIKEILWQDHTIKNTLEDQLNLIIVYK